MQVDVAVIGAGIAGASVAAELSGSLKVALIEREQQPGYHATGRSAAVFSETYGKPAIRLLSSASRAFFDAPPAGFAAAALLSKRGALMIGRADQLDLVRAEADEARQWCPGVREVDAQFIIARVPILRHDYVAGGVLEPDAMDIDVHALHQGYLRWLRANGSQLHTAADVARIEHDGTAWNIEADGLQLRANILVNATGAWCDELALRAGVPALGFTPLRRTAILLEPPAGTAMHDWPMVRGADEEFYFKPDAGRILASPADETPSEPCDAQPDELDVAICVDHIERATTLEVRRIAHRWAGLRTFSRDRLPVVGFDARKPGFFWLAGQGGYGMQTAPALSRLAASLVRGEGVPADLRDAGIDAQEFSPARFA